MAQEISLHAQAIAQKTQQLVGVGFGSCFGELSFFTTSTVQNGERLDHRLIHDIHGGDLP